MNSVRVALIIPHTDITLETDLKRELSERHIVHTQRIWLDEVGEAAEKKMVDDYLPRAIEYLKGITEFQAVVFGCTSASAVYGKEGLIRLEDYISKELGCRGKSAFGAVLDQLNGRNRNNIALVTPYTHEVNRFMEKALEEFGYRVYYSEGMGFSRDTDIAKITPEDIIDFIGLNRERIYSEEGTLLVSCTNLRAAEIRQSLESMLKMPVVTSNQSLIDWLLE